MFEDELAAWQEQVEAVRRANERLGRWRRSGPGSTST